MTGKREQALGVGKNYLAGCQGKKTYNNESPFIKGLIIYYLSLNPKNVSQGVHGLPRAEWLTDLFIEVSLILQPSPAPIVQDGLDGTSPRPQRDSTPLEA